MEEWNGPGMDGMEMEENGTDPLTASARDFRSACG